MPSLFNLPLELLDLILNLCSARTIGSCCRCTRETWQDEYLRKKRIQRLTVQDISTNILFSQIRKEDLILLVSSKIFNQISTREQIPYLRGLSESEVEKYAKKDEQLFVYYDIYSPSGTREYMIQCLADEFLTILPHEDYSALISSKEAPQRKILFRLSELLLDIISLGGDFILIDRYSRNNTSVENFIQYILYSFIVVSSRYRGLLFLRFAARMVTVLHRYEKHIISALRNLVLAINNFIPVEAKLYEEICSWPRIYSFQKMIENRVLEEF